MNTFSAYLHILQKLTHWVKCTGTIDILIAVFWEITVYSQSLTSSQRIKKRGGGTLQSLEQTIEELKAKENTVDCCAL